MLEALRWVHLGLSLAVLFAVLGCALGKDPDVGKNMLQIVSEHGYPIEAHNVTTKDGYILTAFRIPHGRAGPQDGVRPAVLLQHALLCSSFDWVNQSPEQSLGFILADHGYDVWLTNNRGNQWAMAHESLPVDSDAFWDFSWDDMALSDLPANVDFILAATGHAQLAYIGHSEGTTQAFAGFSHNHTLASKVSLFIALAPIAYVHNQRSPVFSALADLHTASFLSFFGLREFLPSGSLINKICPGICSLIPFGCDDAIFLFCGPTRHVNATRLPVFLSKTPAGTSVKNMNHWTQQVLTDTFQMYDYGSKKRNLDKYGTETPPPYVLADLTVKTALFTGGHDILGDSKDTARLVKEVPSTSVVHTLNVEDYAHLDFAWGEDAVSMVYPDVLSLLANYTS